MGLEKALLYSAVSDGEHSISCISKSGDCNLNGKLLNATQEVLYIFGSVILMDSSKWTASAAMIRLFYLQCVAVRQTGIIEPGPIVVVAI